jgi:crotonobetainyl-CoA:carnitine CoA-transferase CaiB-like acyl-CoA transferase
MALADMVAGLYGAFATMTALREIELKGGKGQIIDLSLLEPLISILGGDAALHHVTGKAPMRTGNRSLTASPRNTYETKDGSWLAISGSMQAMAMRLFRAIGREDMCDDPRYSTNVERVARADEVDAIVQDWVGARTLAENLAFFEKAEVTAGPVYDAGQLRQDPHVIGREVFVEMPEDGAPGGVLPMHNIIPRLSETPGAIRRAAPTLGQDTDALLTELGLDKGQIEALREANVVA